MPLKKHSTTDNYSVVWNSDRVHICLHGTPVETHFFKDFADDTDEGSEEKPGQRYAIGFAVVKAMKFNNGEITVSNKQ